MAPPSTPPPDGPRRDPQDSTNVWAIASGGTQLAVSVLLGVYIGHRIDGKWGTGPWGLVGGAALGAALGLYAFLKPLLSKDGRR
jgi:F0F1-type ATP synthase assembly protein I